MIPLEQALQMARQAAAGGQHEQAESIYQRIVAAVPLEAFVWNEMAGVQYARADIQAAARSLARAAELSPHDPAYHSNLGVMLRELGHKEQAIACYRRALSLNPSLAEVHNNLAILLADLERHPEAVAEYERALALKPDYSEAHHNLGNALRAMGQLESARAAYEVALRLRPQDVDTLRAIIPLLKRLLDMPEAERRARELVAQRPRDPDAHATLASILHDQLHLDEAAKEYLQVADLSGPDAHVCIRAGTILPPVYQSMDELERYRQRIVENVRQLRQSGCVCDVTNEPASAVFYTAYQGYSNRELHSQIARLYRAPHFPEVLQRATKGRDRIRVGFLSAYFYNHTIGGFTRGYIAELPRDRFEVHVFSIGRRFDQTADYIRQRADHFDQLPKDLPQARELLLSRQLDVLLYPEIGMSPTAYTLAMSRLAPVQCVTWGHPDTTGIPSIDYFLSSRNLEPAGAESEYSETLVQFDQPPAYYYRPHIEGAVPTRSEFGLDDVSHVYGCLQSLFKFHPDFDAIIAQILRADLRGVLLLSGGHQAWQQALQVRLKATAPDIISRVRFLPRMDQPVYLRCLSVCDVLLDPIHFGGGNTSYEGLSLGVPIVTLPGKFMRSRVTSALYRQMNVLDAVARDSQDYVNLAVRLGGDQGYRGQVSAKILASNDVLFENAAAIAELAQFLASAVKKAGSATGDDHAAG